MHAKELLLTSLIDQGISTEVVGNSIYRFSQYQCEWMVPQYIIDCMLDNDVDTTANYIITRLFYLVRRIDD
jgi:hypothetical protein